MVAPSALLAIQDGSGAVENQGQGYVQQLTPGDSVTFTLQSEAGIVPGMRWDVLFQSADTPRLDGLRFVWSPNVGRLSPFGFILPSGGFLSRYVTTIYDAEGNPLSQYTGEITGTGTSGGIEWPLVIPTASTPEINQAQALSGPGKTERVRTQAAASGSNGIGGDQSFIVGKNDGTAIGGGGPFFWWGAETAIGGVENPITNYFNYGILKVLAGGVVNLVLGGGNNNIGGGIAAVEISAFSELNLATEGGNSPINIQPASSFGGQSLLTCAQDPTDGEAIFATTSQADPPALSGIWRLGWAHSTTSQKIIAQRNGSNTGDYDIISRSVNELIFGSYLEDNRYHAIQNVLFEILNSGGNGWTFSGPNGLSLAVGTDSAKTLAHGGGSINDGWKQALISFNTTSTTAHQTIAAISITDNAITRVRVAVTGEDETTNEWATFDLVQGFRSLSGTVTAPTSPSTPVDTGHSTSGTGVSLQFAIVSNQVAVQVTPWSANSTHWVVRVELDQNTGTF